MPDEIRDEIDTKSTSANDDHHAEILVPQKPLFGIGAGILTAAAGTVLWIVVAQTYQLTWFSAVIAYGIASAIRYAGKARDFWYGIVGALLSTIVALTGNLATAIFIVSKRGKTPSEILAALDIGTAITFLKALSGPIGIFFYAAVIFIGFWFSFQHISPSKNETE